MKRFIPLFLIGVLFASCEKEPNLNKVQENYVVYTQYDKLANFSKGHTFYVADSVLVINDNNKKKASYLDAKIGDFVINTYVSHMKNRGYIQSDNKSDATFGLQISFVESTYYYLKNPSWWSNYPWYWSPSYWWPWYSGDWYYPYPFIYSHIAGSLVCEIVDITSVSKENNLSKPTVIWNSYITDIGVITTNNENKVAKAIDQAFNQSTYIKYNNVK